MFARKFKVFFMIISLALTSSAVAQGLGGTELSAAPDRFRSEIEAGFIFPEFSLFKFGDMRNVFPVSGGEVLQDVFNERHYHASYDIGAREALKLPGNIFNSSPELTARFGLYNAHKHSSFSENEATPEVYVPYIDGNIRPALAGGAVVGLFANSNLQLKRKLFSYELEADLRLSYNPNWSLMPGIFFTYQRIQQKDFLDTTVSTDPTQMTLSAHVNSNHYSFGGNFRFTSPVSNVACWLGSVAVGAEYASGHYNGRQTFTGDVFDEPDEQLAQIRSNRHKWGVSVGAETGVCFFCNHKVSLSILGNFRYMNVLPYVNYPTPILNTQAVTGPATLKFQNQFTFGGVANLSVVF